MLWHLRLLLIFLIGATTTAKTARAFDINGYKTGMTFEEVSNIVARRGIYLKSTDDPSRSKSYITMAGPDQLTRLPESFAFCDGRLDFYSSNLAGGFPTFVRLLERRTELLGHAKVDAQTAEIPEGAFYDVTVGWWEAGQKLPFESLSLNQLGNQTVDVSHTFRETPSNC